MRRIGSRLAVSLFAGLTALGLFLGLFEVLRAGARDEAVRNASAAFAVVVDLVADGASTGYFQWTEFRDAVAAGRQDQVAGWLGEIPGTLKFTLAASVESRPPREARSLRTEGTRLFLDFAVTDSSGLRPLPDRTGVVELDTRAVLKVARADGDLRLATEGLPFFAGLKVAAPAGPVTPLDLGFSLGMALLAAGAPWLAYRREDRFFYEAKGLDTIIFLFENTERHSASHSRNVAELTVALGRRLGYRGRRLKDLRTAALLHDIGKIAVPQEILKKPGALTPEELALIRTHAASSARILRYFDELRHLAPIVLSHHEKMDGSGYPEGLRGDQIPPESRIIAVADVYEALTGTRPYRTPFAREQALAVLREMPLDPEVVAVLSSVV